ncbi:zinc ribbon domain-containing protein [Spirilliplanes yamanashiensis]|uniref:Uncharacterized protein n=1 Tax=Spirilliplanes yamanashiensis TaxID=42233 RepID=A0A8J4DKS1_9ACTN|nr:zinc ribbon domain-containing protein [Spirilliplanes yamanashiensis]MDP9816084.1 hypothetical protein [Spirilliplanes yamanashiensis]GIJ05607.1 hypothetical protein Sya03_49590 [Spirilliplanes yamanashiensis]
MALVPCSNCGRPINPSVRCPHCGTVNALDDELARIERSITEMNLRDMAIVKERSQLASKLQAARFQRDILAHANAERAAQQGQRTRRVRRRRPTGAMPPGAVPPGPVPPSGVLGDGVTALLDDPPPTDRSVPPPPEVDLAAEPAPEASSRSVQNIMLALSVLLIGVSAVVFASFATSGLNALARATILAIAAVAALALAPVISRRELTTTAETVAAVGLTLVPLTGYALHGVDALGGGVSEQLFLGLTFLVTAVVAFGYTGTVRLAAPRYATVLAVQPVPPLLAYDLIESPAGWAAVLTAVAVIDLVLLTTLIRRGRRLEPEWPETVPLPPDDPDHDAHERFESAPEEPDLVIGTLTPPRASRWRGVRWLTGPRPEGAPPPGTEPPVASQSPPSARWLRELTFTLLAAAVVVALFFATAALTGADVTSDALRSGLLLVLAAVVGVVAAHLLDNRTIRSAANAVLVLSIIGAAARVAAVGAPAWTFAVTAAAIAVTGAAVRLLPDGERRAPQYASAAALAVVGVVVALDVLGAAVAPVRAARPVWQIDPALYADRMAAADTGGWQLVVSGLLLTLAAALALPREYRHAGAVAGVALTALAVPASMQLSWTEAPWPLVVAAIGLGVAGLAAGDRRAAVAHIAAAGVVGLFGAGAALAAPWLTAAALTAITGAGIMVALVARQLPTRLYAWQVGDWAAGAAALALPGAVAAAGVAAQATGGATPPATEDVTVPVMAVSFVAVAVTLAYAAVSQVARREVSTPLTVGTGLGALAVTVAAFRAPGATAPDVWVGALLMVAAVLLFFAPTIDANRRSDRMVDGPDVAAAAATVAIIGALARVVALAYPTATLVAAAAVVLIVAFGVRALPADWRRGPVLGAAAGGVVILTLAGWRAGADGLRILGAPGPLWASDVDAVTGSGDWQAPVALVLLAVAAAAALPRPWSSWTSGLAAALATVGAPAAFGLPWWAPLLLGGAVALGYGVASTATSDPRAAAARASVAGVVSVHAVAVGLVRPWSTGIALLVIVVVCVVVAALAKTAPQSEAVAEFDDEVLDLALDDTGMPRHLAQIGGAATAGALIALPGVFAALTAGQGRTAQVVLTAALAASALCLAVLALFSRYIAQYLPYATIGLVGGATATALASLPTNHPTALYAAAAALLGVIAELLRGAVRAPSLAAAPETVRVGERPRWYPGASERRWTLIRPLTLRDRWSVDPATGAVAVAALPTALALASIAPALKAALVDPLGQLGAVWEGPIPALADPALAGRVDGTSVLAAVLLTIAAALAALGFGGRPAETVPVVLPGLAVTLLITPVALNAPWPASTTAGLAVFTLAMLGLALTPPPVDLHAPMLRFTRTAVFVIGLLAGNAGLAGALAERRLTLFTLGSAVGVGLVAAIAGRSQRARILGWLFAALMAHGFVLTLGESAGYPNAWTAFGALAVGAGLLILEATLPRLGRPEHLREATVVEWAGYASALLALALAYDSPSHLAALFAAWGAVLGLSAIRPSRAPSERRTLFWVSAGFEVVALWLLMTVSDVALPEAYTLPFAALALGVGIFEARHRPDLSSWAAYGPALLAAFVPTIGIVLTTDSGDVREVLLLLGAVATLIVGSKLQQQAPVVVGAAATTIAALHFSVTLVGPWLVLLPLAVLLLFLGATNENRRRTQERLRGALVRMR